MCEDDGMLYACLVRRCNSRQDFNRDSSLKALVVRREAEISNDAGFLSLSII